VEIQEEVTSIIKNRLRDCILCLSLMPLYGLKSLLRLDFQSRKQAFKHRSAPRHGTEKRPLPTRLSGASPGETEMFQLSLLDTFIELGAHRIPLIPGGGQPDSAPSSRMRVSCSLSQISRSLRFVAARDSIHCGSVLGLWKRPAGRSHGSRLPSLTLRKPSPHIRGALPMRLGSLFGFPLRLFALFSRMAEYLETGVFA
jgi:hypothetical protein